MVVRVEANACTAMGHCPRIVSIEGDDESIFVVGKRPSARERALFRLPDDEDVVKYPRHSALTWAAAEGRRMPRTRGGEGECA